MMSRVHSLPASMFESARQFRIGFLVACAAGVVGLLGWSQLVVAAEAGSRPMVEEVLVTARKREERLVDTPVAVSALSEEGIERYNTRDIDQLTSRIPGVQIGHAAGGGAGGSMFIRGVGNLAVDYGADQPVSLVMDGMSFSRGHILDTGFFDLAAVEVLKGPQALYFGKNSPAGVIAVTSVTPEVGAEMEGFVRGAYEFRTEDPVVEAGVSFPLGEHLAMRLAGRYQNMNGGYLKNTAQPFDPNPLEASGDPTRGKSYDDYPEQEQEIIRWTTVWEPMDNFDATLKVFYSRSEQNDAGRTVLYACADGPGANPYYNGGIEIADPSQTCPNSKPKRKRNGALPPASIANTLPGVDAGDNFFNKLSNKFQTLDNDIPLRGLDIDLRALFPQEFQFLFRPDLHRPTTFADVRYPNLCMTSLWFDSITSACSGVRTSFQPPLFPLLKNDSAFPGASIKPPCFSAFLKRLI